MGNKVLIIDDETMILSTLKSVLSREPYDVICVESGEEALAIMEKEEIALIITDEMMPGMTGIELLAIARKKYPDTFRMILTGFANLESAITAINKGEVYRFFTKPCNIDDLIVAIRQALEHRELKKENMRLVEKVKEQKKTITDLEKKQPGITRVKRDFNGAVIIES
jgi:DNA-binding NtrC family response regulator